jgi:hypothetical protein
MTAVALLAVACTGCGSSSPTGPSTSGLPAAAGASRDIGGPLPTLGPAAFDSSRTGLPDTTPVSHEHRDGCLTSEAWTVVGTRRDGRKLLLHTGGSSGLLLRYAGSAVRETTDSVEIGTYLIQLKHGDGAGISAVSFLPVSINLAQRLGTRTLLHVPVTYAC